MQVMVQRLSRNKKNKIEDAHIAHLKETNQACEQGLHCKLMKMTKHNWGKPTLRKQQRTNVTTGLHLTYSKMEKILDW